MNTTPLQNWYMLEILAQELATGPKFQPAPLEWETFPVDSGYLVTLITNYAVYDPRFNAVGLRRDENRRTQWFDEQGCARPLWRYLGLGTLIKPGVEVAHDDGRLRGHARTTLNNLLWKVQANRHTGWMWIADLVRRMEEAQGLVPLDEDVIRFSPLMPNERRDEVWAPTEGRFAGKEAHRKKAVVIPHSEEDKVKYGLV